MNVTVHVASALVPAFEGRRQVSLGLPPSADVGDLVQALLALYPRLGQHLIDDRRETPVQVRLLADIPEGRGVRVREGQQVYLVADQPRRLTDPDETVG